MIMFLLFVMSLYKVQTQNINFFFQFLTVKFPTIFLIYKTHAVMRQVNSVFFLNNQVR